MSAQKARRIGCKRASYPLKGVLGIAALAILEHREVARRHARALAQILERELAMGAPFANQRALEFASRHARQHHSGRRSVHFRRVKNFTCGEFHRWLTSPPS